jgi:hypothetical protein
MRWRIYRLTNNTMREIYIGIARDVELRELKHAGYIPGGAKTIAHWDWDRDDIRRYTYPQRFNSDSRASNEAHRIEKECKIPSGYSIFLTPGL